MVLFYYLQVFVTVEPILVISIIPLFDSNQSNSGELCGFDVKVY